jgi:hypothetical protein
VSEACAVRDTGLNPTGAAPASATMTRACAIAVRALALAALLSACAAQPPAPEWQANASGSLERSLDAWLSGDTRVAGEEFERVRREIARTGRPALLARAELARCAGRGASLLLEPCAGYQALVADAEPAERAYAAYLAGHAGAAEAALLPQRHRALAAAAATPASDLAALRRMEDPLARLVGAAVSLQSGRADREVVALAVDTASAQGWRRPLLAWLHVQARQAEAAGEADAAARIRRRIELVGGAAGPTAKTGSPAS